MAGGRCCLRSSLSKGAPGNHANWLWTQCSSHSSHLPSSHTAWFCTFLLQVVALVGGLGLSWQATFGIILTLYFYSHYFFASGEPAGTIPPLCHCCAAVRNAGRQMDMRGCPPQYPPPLPALSSRRCRAHWRHVHRLPLGCHGLRHPRPDGRACAGYVAG